MRIRRWAVECTGNPNVRRSLPREDVTGQQSYGQPGLVQQVTIIYLNADTRLIEGLDTSILYSIDTDLW